MCVPNTAGRIRAHLATVLNYFRDYDNQPNGSFITTKVVCSYRILMDSSSEKVILSLSSNWSQGSLKLSKFFLGGVVFEQQV